MVVIMMTSVAVLALTTLAFTAYDLATYRQNRVESLRATAAIMADHSRAALALRDEKDARQTLASLRADSRVVAAALYDGQGHLFVRYPAEDPTATFPAAPGNDGWRSEGGQVVLIEPVMEGGTAGGDPLFENPKSWAFMDGCGSMVGRPWWFCLDRLWWRWSFRTSCSVGLPARFWRWRRWRGPSPNAAITRFARVSSARTRWGC